MVLSAINIGNLGLGSSLTPNNYFYGVLDSLHGRALPWLYSGCFFNLPCLTHCLEFQGCPTSNY